MSVTENPWDANPAPGYKLHPDHEVKCKAYTGAVKILFDGTQIANSTAAYVVEETNHKPVYYLPLQDVAAEFLVDSSHVTRCPFKGKARYWNLRVGDHEIDNALWSYEMPYDEALELAGLVAFYDTKVEIIATPDA